MDRPDPVRAAGGFRRGGRTVVPVHVLTGTKKEKNFILVQLNQDI